MKSDFWYVSTFSTLHIVTLSDLKFELDKTDILKLLIICEKA